VAYKYKKPYRVRKKKSILRNRLFWSVLLVLAVLGTLVYFLFFSRVFQIKDVVISGDNEISRQELEGFFLAQNIFLLNKDRIESNILYDFPKIAEVKISRIFPSSVRVDIKERQAVLVWCDEEKECFLTDKTGTFFGEVYYEDADLPTVFGEKDLLNEKMVEHFSDIDAKLKKELDFEIEKILLVSPQQFNVKTNEGWEIYFSSEKDVNWQLTQLHLVLARQISEEERKELEYIDLRFERVYYK